MAQAEIVCPKFRAFFVCFFFISFSSSLRHESCELSCFAPVFTFYLFQPETRKGGRGKRGGGGEWRGSGLAEGTSACLELRDAWTKGREVQRDTGVDDQRKEGRRGKREL